jgi:hypothetical protein
MRILYLYYIALVKEREKTWAVYLILQNACAAPTSRNVQKTFPVFLSEKRRFSGFHMKQGEKTLCTDRPV